MAIIDAIKNTARKLTRRATVTLTATSASNKWEEQEVFKATFFPTPGCLSDRFLEYLSVEAYARIPEDWGQWNVSVHGTPDDDYAYSELCDRVAKLMARKYMMDGPDYAFDVDRVTGEPIPAI